MNRALAFLVAIFLILTISACGPSPGDRVVAKNDSAHLLAEFGQFSMSDPRAKPCVVYSDQVLTVVRSGYNDLWEIPYIEVRSAECADGRTLSPAYGSPDLFRTVE